jgi:hypothetical protein
MFFKKPSSTTRTPWCHSLNEDVLRLVIKEVDTSRGLYNLCQVSRQFYQLTVMKLYCFFELDISTPSHQRLLHRRARPDDLFARYIRGLIIDGIKYGQLQSAFHLSRALSRLINLESLVFTSSVVSPKCILDTLCNGVVDSGFHAAVLMPNMLQPLYTSMTALAYIKLNFLYIGLEIADQVQDTFKRDLVQMLLRARCLKILQIWIDFDVDQEFSSLLPDFDYEGFPKLDELWLVTGQEMEVFNPDELRRWGAVGGWNNLQRLTSVRSRELSAFIDQVPRLKDLCFIPWRYDDIDILESYLSDAQCEAPFGKEIRSIRLQGNTYSSSLPTGLSYAMPWCLLKYVPNVTKLDTHRARFEGWLPGSSLTTITTQDLVQLRNMCPRLEEFWIDVIYGPKSPAKIDDLIANLAQIEKLSKSVIYVHNGSSNFARLS